jgi:transcriptional regulator with XRE-family HTH domain
MRHYALCALRTHRRTWGLSQRELADLLGFQSPTHISRLEQGKRVPGLETALACSTLFGVPPGELFPQLALEIEVSLRKKITRLHEGSLHTTSTSVKRKRELFTHALERVGYESEPARA